MADDLARMQMHAVQTSGNTIRNVTADPFAGAAADEIADPRPIAELIRQWSTDHSEFLFLPRKFKIKITVSENGLETIRGLAETRFQTLKAEFTGVDQTRLAQIETQFAPPLFKSKDIAIFEKSRSENPVFRAGADTNRHPHKAEAYAIVAVSLKAHGAPPGNPDRAADRNAL